jgi:hypothetical protein
MKHEVRLMGTEVVRIAPGILRDNPFDTIDTRNNIPTLLPGQIRKALVLCDSTIRHQTDNHISVLGTLPDQIDVTMMKNVDSQTDIDSRHIQTPDKTNTQLFIRNY